MDLATRNVSHAVLIACLVLMLSLPIIAVASDASEWVTKAPFDWDPLYSTPGTSLRIEEASRETLDSASLIEYRFTATGFDADGDATMWMKQGPAYRAHSATIDSTGLVVVGGADLFMVSGFVAGQSLDVALVSGEMRAHAKVFPFPIESQEADCRIQIELLSPKGNIFMASVSGFDVGEPVRVESLYKDEHIDQVIDVPADGVIDMPLVYGEYDRGTATLRVSGAECTTSVTYGVGEDAF